MADSTDGHSLNTGDGPKPLAAVYGVALEGKAQAAYRLYLESNAQDLWISSSGGQREGRTFPSE
jgi:hypothetical protein